MYVYNISFAFFDNLLHTKKVMLKKYKKCSTVQTTDKTTDVWFRNF